MRTGFQNDHHVHTLNNSCSLFWVSASFRRRSPSRVAGVSPLRDDPALSPRSPSCRSVQSQGSSGQFPECFAAVMAAPGRRGAALVPAVLGFWQLGPVAAREWAARFPSLLGCQRRCVSCVAGATSSGPLLASASRRYGPNSALDRLLGLPQPDSSLPLAPRVPAVSMNRGKKDPGRFARDCHDFYH